MSYFRLKHTHPTNEKLNKIFDLMHKLNISMSVDNNKIVITDKELDKEFEMLDLEMPFHNNTSGIDSLPPLFDYKLVFEKED